MGKGKKRKRPKMARREKRIWYPLSEVKALVAAGNVVIQGNARDSAYYDFGWNTEDILDALSKLQSKHHYKYDCSKIKPQIVIDYYKAKPLKGEAVYIHFYIDDDAGMLIVNSFKEI